MALKLTEMFGRYHRATRVLRDWIGNDGIPIEQEKAESRAAICLHCPANSPARWWEKAANMIADAIRKQLEVKNKMGLRLSTEDKVGMCRACGCCIRLKVWVPIEHIRAHVTSRDREGFQNASANHPRGLRCWIENEL